MHMNKRFAQDLANKRTVCCAKTFDCCRFVYNRMLEIKPCIMTPLRSRYTSLSNTKPSLSGWVKWIHSHCETRCYISKRLSKISSDKSIVFPRIKSKHQGHYSYTTNLDYVDIELASYLKLPKLGGVSVKQHRQVLSDYKLKSVQCHSSSLKYYASIL
jgi:hypothetical protein